MGWIYKITNNKNNKVYIGQTRRKLEQRWKEHIRDAHCGKQDKFHNAMREIGIENFQMEPISYYEDNSWLNWGESYSIGSEDSYHNGYNSNGGPCGDLREFVLDHEVWNKAIMILVLSKEMNEDELMRITEMLKRGATKAP